MYQIYRSDLMSDPVSVTSSWSTVKHSTTQRQRERTVYLIINSLSPWWLYQHSYRELLAVEKNSRVAGDFRRYDAHVTFLSLFVIYRNMCDKSMVLSKQYAFNSVNISLVDILINIAENSLSCQLKILYCILCILAVVCTFVSGSIRNCCLSTQDRGVISISLTHWGRDKMATVFQTTFSNTFSWMKMYEFRLRFHWRLFPRFDLTIFQHWFR